MYKSNICKLSLYMRPSSVVSLRVFYTLSYLSIFIFYFDEICTKCYKNASVISETIIRIMCEEERLFKMIYTRASLVER